MYLSTPDPGSKDEENPPKKAIQDCVEMHFGHCEWQPKMGSNVTTVGDKGERRRESLALGEKN